MNRIEIFDDLSFNEANEIKDNQNVKYIQISKEIPQQALKLVNDIILTERSDIQFRVYGFYGIECNLKFLENLTNIVNLSIGEINSISVNNIDALSCITNLKSLRICFDELKDISFLANLSPNIINLMLGTGIQNSHLDFSIIERFQFLETLFIYKINNGYSILKKMNRLKKLTINSSNIREFTFLKETNINTLSLGMMRNCDCSTLNGNEKINQLELYSLNGLDDLSILSELPKLEGGFIAQNNRIERIPELRKCKDIKILILDRIKKLSDISELAFVPNVERIEIYQAKLVDLLSIEEILKNPSLKSFRCTTGSMKKDRQIKELIEEYGKL